MSSVDSTNRLIKALACDTQTHTLQGGETMIVYADKSQAGRPLVLVHSINAAPSAMEMKPLFENFRARRPCYAPDLPGFGLSPREPIEYTAAFFSDAINELLRDVTREHGQAPDVVALSLSSEFAARAVVELDAPCHSLIFISPTGLSRRAPPGPKFSDRVNAVTGTPLLGRALYRLLTTRGSIRYFLSKAFTHEAPEEVVAYAQQTARLPGARYAPFAFLSMRLFSAGALDSLYSQLTTPTLVIYDEDPNIDFDRLPELLARNSLAQATRIAPTQGLPHWEQLQKTLDAMTHFWSTITE